MTTGYGPAPAPRSHDLGVARVLGLVVLVPVVRALSDPSAAQFAAAALGLAALAVHLVALSDLPVAAGRVRAAGLAGLTLASGAAAHAIAGHPWVFVALAAGVQCAVRLGPLPPAVAGITICAAASLGMGQIYNAVTSLVIVSAPGLIAALRHRLMVTIAELRTTREQLAIAAVRRERDRFSDDLHDLLGHSLSVMVVSAQVVQRVAGDRPDQAASVAAEIETIGRRALDDVRAAVLGYRGRSLTDEMTELRRALQTAGITPEFTPPVEVPESIDATLALVLREAVTNVVRHSHAHTCRVGLHASGRDVTLEVTDDGSGNAAAAARAAAGLATVRARLAGHGGLVTIEAVAPHGLRVTAVVPFRQEDRSPS
jgi:two-component system sensor histidine kinase DesK